MSPNNWKVRIANLKKHYTVREAIRKVFFYPPPYLPYMQHISNSLQSFFAITHRILNFRKEKYYLDLPLAVYDLRFSPASYDLAYFLYEADCYFRGNGYEKFNLVIVPEIAESTPPQINEDWKQVISEDSRRQRIFNLLLPMASMYESCSSVSLINDVELVVHICRSHFCVFPQNYDGVFIRTHMSYRNVYDFERKKTYFSGFSSFSSDLDKVKSWISSQGINLPFITFTVRYYAHQPQRHSNIPDYLKFASYLSEIGISSVFIPDTDDLSYISELSEYPVFFTGAFNLYQRQAIYELALTNIFACSGCHSLCALNKRCSYIMSGIINENYNMENLYKPRGLKYGDQPFCDNRGVWEWGGETFDSLKNSFDLLLKLKSSTNP